VGEIKIIKYLNILYDEGRLREQALFFINFFINFMTEKCLYMKEK